MYFAPTDHESALDLWQCMCIIVKMLGWGCGVEKEEEVLRFVQRLSFFFFFFLDYCRTSPAFMPLTCKTIAATWLSPGHPGPHCFHMGRRQHSLLAIKIAEDKRQTASTSWQICICRLEAPNLNFVFLLICGKYRVKTYIYIYSKLNWSETNSGVL